MILRVALLFVIAEWLPMPALVGLLAVLLQVDDCSDPSDLSSRYLFPSGLVKVAVPLMPASSPCCPDSSTPTISKE